MTITPTFWQAVGNLIRDSQSPYPSPGLQPARSEPRRADSPPRRDRPGLVVQADVGVPHRHADVAVASQLMGLDEECPFSVQLGNLCASFCGSLSYPNPRPAVLRLTGNVSGGRFQVHFRRDTRQRIGPKSFSRLYREQPDPTPERKMRYLFLAFVLICSPLVAEDKTATRKEFDEFARLMTGRFASEIKLIHDWPGHKKKRGDVIAGIRIVSKVADGSAFMVTDAAGTGIGKELCVYNAATKRIESLIVFTGGTVMHVVTWKKSSDKWNWVLTGSLEDGKEIKGRGYWEAKNKGKQLHLISDDFTIGGKSADKLHDKYIRVK